LANDQLQDIGALRPERHADADLARALRHDIRHHAVEPDGRKRHRHAGEDPQE
jgi:hypothetical protein